MAINLEIPDNQYDFLRGVYDKRASEILRNIQELEAEYRDITPMLIALGLKSAPPAKVEHHGQKPFFEGLILNDYKESFTWEQKALYVLNRKNHLTSKQIIDILKNNLEPNLDLEKAINSLPATLSVAANSEKSKIIRNKNEAGEFIYSI